MPLSRRDFLSLAASSLTPDLLLRTSRARASETTQIRALVFDAFPILDLRPVFLLAEELFPGRGAELSNLWRIRQFEYQWLRALSGQYVDFWQATDDALVYSATTLKLELSTRNRTELMQAYLQLKVWPDVPSALHSLRASGVRLGVLSNATAKILEAGIRNSGLTSLFEHVLSTDTLSTYKPDPRAYQMALDAFRLPREEIGFSAFAGWDVAGAKWFGYPTFWVNRLKAPPEELGVSPDATVGSVADLVTLLQKVGLGANTRS